MCYLKNSSLQTLLDKYKDVFKDGAQPKVCKARPVPYAMRELVEKELDRDRLVSEGTIESTQFADWAVPIVPVLKGDKVSIRICGESLSKPLIQIPVSKLDKYPIPIE